MHRSFACSLCVSACLFVAVNLFFFSAHAEEDTVAGEASMDLLAGEKCYEVKKGRFYPSGVMIFHGFANKNIARERVLLHHDTVEYMMDPSNEKGQMCQGSWNKLWGQSRCGFLRHHHKDSARFVWRRDPTCFVYENGRVVSEKPDCPGKDILQFAAYSYDNGRKPFQHQGDLLKIFTTKFHPDTEYNLELDFQDEETIYRVYDADLNLLEEQFVKQRYCKHPERGYKLGLYFGGQCRAPSPVSICYE